MPGADPCRPGRHHLARHGSATPQVDRRGQALSRPAKPGEVALESLNPDPFARLTLALLRLYFQTFAAPASQGWLAALRLATIHVGPRAAPALCYESVALVQALREARSSPFRFNPEGCACCRQWLTPEERLLLEFLAALRGRRRGRAQALVQLLCDGSPSDTLIAVAEIFLSHHAPEFTTTAGPVPAPLHPKTQGE